ncbi:MAG: AI-2E family transporter [Candidatus Paceibacterota bacterium]
MQNKSAFNAQEIFFIALIAIVGVGSFFVFKPYLYSILFALIVAIAIEPLYNYLVKLFRNHTSIASLISILLVIFIVAIPVGFFGWKIVEGVQDLYVSLTAQSTISLAQSIQEILPNFITKLSPHIAQSIDGYIQQALSFVMQNVGPVFSGLVVAVADILVSLFSLFFILKHKTKLVALVKRISPVPDGYDDIIIRRMQTSINSVLRGTLTVSLIQGIICSVGFTIFGLPNPMVWGALAALAALVPSLGTSLVTIPSIIFLFSTGDTFAAVGLLIWSALAVGLIDNLLAPYLIDKGLKLHPIITLLAILGGVAFFGPLGFILGPVVVVLFVTLLETYTQIHKKEPFL